MAKNKNTDRSARKSVNTSTTEPPPLGTEEDLLGTNMPRRTEHHKNPKPLLGAEESGVNLTYSDIRSKARNTKDHVNRSQIIRSSQRA